MRRYNDISKNGDKVEKKQDPVYQSVKESPVAEQRLQNQQSMLMQSVNVASIAVLTTLGVSYFLDKIKDKQDKNMREELKDRVESTLKDST